MSLPLQRKGYGREAMEHILDVVTARADPRGIEVVKVLAEVHPRNEPSLSLLAHGGFIFNGLNDDHVYALDYLIKWLFTIEGVVEV